jgi:hypothetical protein
MHAELKLKWPFEHSPGDGARTSALRFIQKASVVLVAGLLSVGPDVRAQQTACGTQQTIGLGSGFALANNNWGSESVPGSPFQCVYRNADNTVGWYWNRPATPSGTLPDFPQMLHGPKPWGGGTGPTELLPRRVRDISSIQMWRDGTHVTEGSTGPWTHTLSLWFTSSSPGGHVPEKITHEVMINIATVNYFSGGQGAALPNAVNDGYRVYHHDRSGPMGHWRIHIFSLAGEQRPLPKRINIKAFLDYLVASETLTGDDWLACWELGDEMNDNTQGHVHLSRLALAVNGTRRAPTAALMPSDITISQIPPQLIAADSSTGPIAFTVQDDVANPGLLTLSGISSNTTLVPNANIVFGGSGSNRTVTVTPAPGAYGGATIRVTASSGVRNESSTFDVSVTSSAPPLVYDFDGSTMQGWTDLTPANNNTGPRNWAKSPPAFPAQTQSGSGAIGQNIVGGNQDSSHPTLWLRSPVFKLNGAGNLTAWLRGGSGSGSLAGTPVSAMPGASSTSGFMGLALRNAQTGTFALSGRKSSSGDDWQEITFTTAQLAALDQNATYTLDLIDARHGGWGWVAMDSVSIPGTTDLVNTAPMIGSIPNQSVPPNTSTGPIPFTIGDAQTPAASLTLSKSSSNTNLVPAANIVFGGSGSNRTVTVTPAADQVGSALITVTVSDGELSAGSAFTLAVNTSFSPLVFDFDDGTLQGWTVVSTDGQGRQFFAGVPPSVSSPHTLPQAGSGFLGLHIPAFGGDPFYYQDSPHGTLWLRSPEFKLNGAGDLTAWLCGGNGYGADATGKLVTNVPANSFDDPGNATFPSFLGLALRNVDTGVFVLAGRKVTNDNEWEQITFAAAQLAALDQNAIYTLDLIDARHGGWGWVNLDSVSIPGTAVLAPLLTITRSTGDQVRIAWPAAATGYVLQRSSAAQSGYALTGLPVTVEGTESVVYDTLDTEARFYRLMK